MRPKRFKAGDVVELRPPAEILATLDDNGRMDGLPFMPEMLASFGKTFRVRARVERACDTISGPGVRRIPDAVILDDLRCDGSFHGGCQAGCRIYWKEAWLRPAVEGAPSDAMGWTDDLDRLAERASRDLVSHDGGKPIYRCQATALPVASVKVQRRESSQSYVMELVSKDVGVRQFLRVLWRTAFEAVGMTLRLIPRGEFMPYDESKRIKQPDEQHAFRPGELVRVRSRDEIARTLGKDGKNRGLWFDREMVPYCGKTARILRKVDRIIDEASGKMIELKSDCYILDGVICNSELSFSRRFCPRGIYPYWRACWLEPVEEAVPLADRNPAAPGEPVGTPIAS